MTFLFTIVTQKKGSVTQKIRLNNTGEEIRAGITKVDRFKANMPVYGSVNDPRMGSSDRNVRCKTCDCKSEGSGSKVDDCPGHFGHIELCRPVYHCGFIKEVVEILRCVCFHCSRLLLDDNYHKDRKALAINDPETRLRLIHDCCRGKRRCTTASVSDVTKLLGEVGIGEEGGDALMSRFGGLEEEEELEGRSSATATAINVPASGEDTSSTATGCGGLMPRYSRDGMKINVEYPDDMDVPGNGDRKQLLSANRAFEILKGITDADAKKLGLDPKYARPEWLLVTVLPVPPPQVRPEVVGDGIASADDLTHMLVNIVKANVYLENSISKGDAPHIVKEFEDLIQNRVTAFFDNERTDSATETQRTGRPLKSIRQRLRGKEGRIRGNLMGKRVDFSARTVITADPNLSIDQVDINVFVNEL
jgi:DNA-directed RNA polymerase II subunit RPB1